MARAKPTWVVNLEYFPILGLYRFLGLLPDKWRLLLWKALVRGVLFFIPKRRRLMTANVVRSFPHLSDHEHETIVQGSIDNLARSAALFSRILRLRAEDWDRLVHFEGLEHVEKALAKGKGAISFTAHYGCWEAMAAFIPRRVPGSAIIVRPLDNPKLDAIVSAVRTSSGGRLIAKRQALSQGLKTLKNNQLLGILVDQNFAAGRLFVDFFGHPAATSPIVSHLARRSGCAVIPLHNFWKEDRLHIVFEPPVTLSRNSDRELAIAEDTQTITRMVEGWIRKDPTQWLWLHNRWKRQPQPGELVWNEPPNPQPNLA